MRHQALRPAALMLSVLLVASSPAKAGTIEYVDAARTAGDGRYARPATELRLRVMSQSGQQVAPGTQAAPQSGDTSSQDQSNASQPGGATSASSDATLTQSNGSGGQIETVDLGDVTGTVCDCGEIQHVFKPKGFPLWPFLALAGIPLAFIPHGGDTPTPPGTPPPPPPPSSVPEPATLFLFGSGLLALGSSARRRRAQKTASHEAVVTAGEV